MSQVLVRKPLSEFFRWDPLIKLNKQFLKGTFLFLLPFQGLVPKTLRKLLLNLKIKSEEANLILLMVHQQLEAKCQQRLRLSGSQRLKLTTRFVVSTENTKALKNK